MMLPLAVCSITAVAVIIERFFFFRRNGDNLGRKNLELIGSNRIDETLYIARNSALPLVRVLLKGIASPDNPAKAMEAAGIIELSIMRRGLPVLDTIVTLSPLLGLLGTIIGMIKAFSVEVVASDAGAERGDQRADLLGRQHLVEAGALDVEDLSAQRQHRLIFAVAALFGGAAGRIALDDEDLGLGRIALLAVGELAGQARDVERALAAVSSRALRAASRACAASTTLPTTTRASCGCSSNHCDRSSLTRPSTTGRTSEETSLSLVCEENFGSGHLMLSTQVRPSRVSSPERSTFSFLSSPDFPRSRRPAG